MNHQPKKELSKFIWALWQRQKQNENNTKLIKGENND